ncbi:hypothetical protein KSD_58110 [Ktedonobacter sp. SOSP1-85]|nr:hypothetical protein KSD_00140 [Ktedonobacter sp. SOSP1-85]GHO78040.1 hypothetical protein KSD_58110 [Ktedonobacter sp. SOSP1-85]
MLDMISVGMISRVWSATDERNHLLLSSVACLFAGLSLCPLGKWRLLALTPGAGIHTMDECLFSSLL